VTMHLNEGETIRMSARQAVRGMTLIELMVVVAVLGILGTVAVNSYRGYLLRSNRTEARVALLKVQSQQEKFFLQNNRYATNAELTSGLGIQNVTLSGFYTISLPNQTNTTYTARAAAAAGQLKDASACHTLEIDEKGVRGPSAAVTANCWGR